MADGVVQESNNIMAKTAKKEEDVLVFFDLETCGKDASTTELVQFGGIKVIGKEMKELKFLVKPSIPIDKGAEEVHGISNAAVQNCKPLSAYKDQLVEFFKDATIVGGYNLIKFDVPILTRQLEELGVKNLLKDKTVFDVYPVYLQHHRRKLADCYKFYCNKELDGAHDAINDVKATFLCYQKQIEMEKKTPKEIIEAQANADSGIDRYVVFNGGEPFINFGKHKGTSFKEMDVGYLSWILKNDFPKDFKEIILKFMNSSK